MVAALSRKVAAMRSARAWGTGSVLATKKRLEGKGRDNGGFIPWFPSLAISVPEAYHFFFPWDSWPEPAACQSVGVAFLRV